MTLEIDTNLKLVKVKGQVSLKELVDTLMSMFPDFEYEKWSITEYPIAAGYTGLGTQIWPQQQQGLYTTGRSYIGDPNQDLSKWKQGITSSQGNSVTLGSISGITGADNGSGGM